MFLALWFVAVLLLSLVMFLALWFVAVLLLSLAMSLASCSVAVPLLMLAIPRGLWLVTVLVLLLAWSVSVRRALARSVAVLLLRLAMSLVHSAVGLPSLHSVKRLRS